MAAQTIEGAVIEQLHNLSRQPDRANVRKQLKPLGPAWPTLAPVVLLEPLRRLIERISYDAATGAVTMGTNPLPTSGLDRYSYDPNGNLLTKTNARNITTSFNNYDPLNRPHSKTYNDGITSEVDYIYDTHFKGALSSVSNGVSTTSYDVYDSMGRVTQSTQTTQGQNPFVFHYTYNSAGAQELLIYPSQRQVTTCYDQAARPQQVRNGTASNAPTYASAVQYAPHGALANMTLGGGLLSEQWQYSLDRLQPTSLTVPGLSLGYFYCPLGASACTTNNGNLQRQTIGTPLLNLTQDYTYDALDRLLTAKENNGANWSQTYSYDAAGNRAVSGYIPRPAWTPTSLSQYWVNNQWRRGNGDQYDNAGNQTALGSDTAPNVVSSTFGYDAENRLVSANIGSTGGVSYQYDGDGRRVKKTVGATVTTYAYDASGQLAAEYSNQSAAVGTMYLTADHLGSTRLVTKSSGGVLRYDYLPFGEDLPQGVGGRGSEYPAVSAVTFPAGADVLSEKFTSKERDAETGLDYFGARYFSAAQGRFTTPDWSSTPQPVPYADLTDPQTLNQYAYVRNNPLSKKDDGGHCTVDGEQHFGWCIWHTLGFYQTEKEQADTARQALSPMHGFTINGQTPAEISKNGTNQQVISAYKIANQFLLGVAQQALSPCPPDMKCGVVPIGPPGALAGAGAAVAEAAAESEGIIAQNGTRIRGFTSHGVDRAIGDTAQRAGTRPEAILDALRNPKKITSGVDQQGRPYQVFVGKDARVVVNPQTGNVVSVNPMSGAGAH